MARVVRWHMTKTDRPYASEWEEYRKRRNAFLLILLTYIPGVFVIGTPLARILGSEAPMYVIAILWMIAFALAGWRLTYWKCPRCEKWFFATWWFCNQLARKCVHCGLPKWVAQNAE